MGRYVGRIAMGSAATAVVFAALMVAFAVERGGSNTQALTPEEITAGERCLDLETIIENTPVGPMSDYGVEESLEELVQQSPIIIRGTLVGQDGPVTSSLPVRYPSTYVLRTVQVNEVLKGDLIEHEITIGHAVTKDYPILPVGCEVMLFLRKVPGKSPGNPGINYVAINGPQGEFAIALGKVSSMVPPSSGWPFDMMQPYRGMSEGQFLQEIGEAIAVTNGQ